VEPAPPGDGLGPTLRFRDAGLEATYQRQSADAARAGQASSFVFAIVLWIVAAALATTVAGIDDTVAVIVAVVMVTMNIVLAVIHRRMRTLDGQQRLFTVGNVFALAGALAVLATTSGDVYLQLAAPTVMLISVFAFVLLRLRFTYAIYTAVAYLVLFVVGGWIAGTGTSVVQVFIVSSSVAVAVGGAYLLERSTRGLYGAHRRIDTLSTRLDALLRRYLSPSLAATLIDRPALTELGGDICDVTILFADVQGFTPFAERADPAATVARLNEYYGAAVPAVIAEDGTVVGFAGDALMAIFNAPIPLPDHALHAARAALTFRERAATLARGQDDLRFRIGLHSGTTLVGNVGSEELRNYTAIGDTPNVAARLQAAATPGTIVIGPLTRALLGDAAVVRDLGRLDLKGKSEPIQAYELLGLQDGAGDATAVATLLT
jgi:class 3 adenylate cyclase